MSEIITKMGGFIINGKFVTRSGLTVILDELETKLKEIKLIHKDCASDYENAEHRANSYRLELKTAMADTEDWKSIARAHHDQVEKLERIIEVQGKALSFYGSLTSWHYESIGNTLGFIERDDCNCFGDDLYGGKRARECIEQVNGLRGEL